MSNHEIKQALISSTHPDALDQLDRFLKIEREFNLEIIEANELDRFCRRLLLDNPWINARSELEDLRADIDRIDTAAQKEMARMQEIIDALKAENERLRMGIKAMGDDANYARIWLIDVPGRCDKLLNP